MSIDKLDDIVNKYNNTYHNMKIKPVDVKAKAYIDSIAIKILNLTLVILLHYQNMTIFLEKVTHQIDLKKLL